MQLLSTSERQCDNLAAACALHDPLFKNSALAFQEHTEWHKPRHAPGLALGSPLHTSNPGPEAAAVVGGLKRFLEVPAYDLLVKTQMP